MEKLNQKRCLLAFVGLVLVLVVLFILNIAVGTVAISPRGILSILSKQSMDSMEAKIIWELRLPRAIAAMVLGGALALSGYLMQTFFQNPIAGPFVLGISSGAKLAVAIAMILLLGNGWTMHSWDFIFAAFLGALCSMGFVLLISSRVEQMSMLIVAGIMVGYICSGVTDFLVTFANDADIVNLHNWSRGSFSGMSWEQIKVMTPICLLSACFLFFLAKPIHAYQLGENYAKGLGVSVLTLRIILVLLSSLLAGCVTAFAGPVSFVGIAVPHIIRQLLKTSKPIYLIPYSFLGGGVFCLFCDLIARTVLSPTELSISTVTAVFGAPIVIAVILQKRRR